MKEALKRGAIRINRARFLRGALASIFGVFAGLTVGVPRVEASACYGLNRCPPGACWGYRCASSPDYTCLYSRTCDNNSTPACWRSGNHTCCDCACATYGYSFYCYCHG